VIIDEKRPLDEYGLDSISAAKLTKLLTDQFKVPLTVYMFLADPTIDGVARKIVQIVATHAQQPSTSSPKLSNDNNDNSKNASLSSSSSSSDQSLSTPEWQPMSVEQVAYILGMGTAVPKRSGTQDEAHRVLVDKLEMDEKQAKFLKKVGMI
jgi:acyl carrier protein